MPWIFAALILGAFLAFNNPFLEITSGETFDFLAQMGMYFLLFMIGLEFDLNKLKESGKFIIKSTFFIILLEGLVGTLLIHFVFGYEWFIAFVVSLSFATVGEAILIPILDEFKIVNTKLGQSILGIGTLDDIIELISLILVVFLMKNSTTHFDIFSVLGALSILFALSFGLNVFKKMRRRFTHFSVDILFLFSLFIFFLFLGIGEFAHSMPVAALLAGLAIKTFVPDERLELIENEIKTMCYGFFAPIFFLQVGLEMDVYY
jgi:Kef-type K+ transport system membrane component KefB